MHACHTACLIAFGIMADPTAADVQNGHVLAARGGKGPLIEPAVCTEKVVIIHKIPLVAKMNGEPYIQKHQAH